MKPINYGRRSSGLSLSVRAPLLSLVLETWQIDLETLQREAKND